MYDVQTVQTLKAHEDAQLKRRVYLKLVCGLTADPTTVIETDEGLKLRVRYGETSGAVYYPKDGDPHPIAGQVLSGADWTLLRSDGVMMFDSRITLKFSRFERNEHDVEIADKPPIPYLLDCTLTGMTDLAEVITSGQHKTDEQIFDSVIRGSYSGKQWALALKARFEGSAGPPAQEDNSWLPKDLRHAATEFPIYRQLVRQELSAYGQVEVDAAPFFPATKITLTMWGKQ